MTADGRTSNPYAYHSGHSVHSCHSFHCVFDRLYISADGLPAAYPACRPFDLDDFRSSLWEEGLQREVDFWADRLYVEVLSSAVRDQEQALE